MQLGKPVLMNLGIVQYSCHSMLSNFCPWILETSFND